MFSIYNAGNIIFYCGGEAIEFPFAIDISDFEDSFVIETQIAIDEIRRGWVGDVRIILSGHRMDDTHNWNDNAKDVVIHKDVLCYRRTMELNNQQAVTWKYMFMKY